jgi:hypothetical protein
VGEGRWYGEVEEEEGKEGEGRDGFSHRFPGFWRNRHFRFVVFVSSHTCFQSLLIVNIYIYIYIS